MNRMLVAAVLASAGCNTLLDLDPSTGALDVPSCASGWTHHAIVDVTNDSGRELRDYQLRLAFDGATAIATGRLAPDGHDLRFVAGDRLAPHEIEGPIDSSSALVWVRVPIIPPGASTLEVLTGAPDVEPLDEPVFVDAIANPSFEEPGGWTIEPALGAPATFNLESTAWASDGLSSLRVDAETSGHHDTQTSSSISQPLELSSGTSYVLRFDVNVIAASNNTETEWNNGSLSFSLGNGLDSIWYLSGHSGNITGIHAGEESRPFSSGDVSLAFTAAIERGDGDGYVKAHVDHLRVRRFVEPEPVATVRAATACP